MKPVHPEDAPELDAIKDFVAQTIDGSQSPHAASLAVFDVSVRALGIIWGDQAPGMIRATAEKLSLVLLSGMGRE